MQQHGGAWPGLRDGSLAVARFTVGQNAAERKGLERIATSWVKLGVYAAKKRLSDQAGECLARAKEAAPDSKHVKAFAKAAVKKYPAGKQASAVIPLLWRVQEQNEGWVSEPAIRWTAEMTSAPSQC